MRTSSTRCLSGAPLRTSTCPSRRPFGSRSCLASLAFTPPPPTPTPSRLPRHNGLTCTRLCAGAGRPPCGGPRRQGGPRWRGNPPSCKKTLVSISKISTGSCAQNWKPLAGARCRTSATLFSSRTTSRYGPAESVVELARDSCACLGGAQRPRGNNSTLLPAFPSSPLLPSAVGRGSVAPVARMQPCAVGIMLDACSRGFLRTANVARAHAQAAQEQRALRTATSAVPAEARAGLAGDPLMAQVRAAMELPAHLPGLHFRAVLFPARLGLVDMHVCAALARGRRASSQPRGVATASQSGDRELCSQCVAYYTEPWNIITRGNDQYAHEARRALDRFPKYVAPPQQRAKLNHRHNDSGFVLNVTGVCGPRGCRSCCCFGVVRGLLGPLRHCCQDGMGLPHSYSRVLALMSGFFFGTVALVAAGI